MREFVWEQMKPSPKQRAAITKELLTKRERKENKYREASGLSPELAVTICLNNWQKLQKQGKIARLGSRKWFMEWDN